MLISLTKTLFLQITDKMQCYGQPCIFDQCSCLEIDTHIGLNIKIIIFIFSNKIKFYAHCIVSRWCNAYFGTTLWWKFELPHTWYSKSVMNTTTYLERRHSVNLACREGRYWVRFGWAQEHILLCLKPLKSLKYCKNISGAHGGQT